MVAPEVRGQSTAHHRNVATEGTPMKSIQRILVATDCSNGAGAAGDVAARLARDLGAAVDILTVVDTSALEKAYGDVTFRTQRIAEIRAIAQERAIRFAKRHLADVAQVTVYVRDGNASSRYCRRRATSTVTSSSWGRTAGPAWRTC